MKLLLAYDDSSAAESALGDLKRAGLPDSGEAVVLSVADVWMPGEDAVLAPPGDPLAMTVESGRVAARRALEVATSRAKRGCERLKEALPGWQVRAESSADAPAWAIIKQADQMNADLVVVGSLGRNLLSRVLVGSVSMRVLMELRRAVRVSRAPRKHADTRILVAVDGSIDADAAVATVRKRKWPADTEIRVITAANWRLQAAAMPKLLNLDMPVNVWAEQIARQAADALAGAARSVTVAIREGSAKTVLAAEADSWEADCIFLGGRGLTRAERWLLGSVSTAVVMRASCSVEVVHGG